MDAREDLDVDFPPFFSQFDEKINEAPYSQNIDEYLKYQDRMLNRTTNIEPERNLNARTVRSKNTTNKTRSIKRKIKVKNSKSKETSLSSHVIKKVAKGKRIIKISISDVDPNLAINTVTVQYIVENDYDDLLSATEHLIEKMVKKLSEDISC